jgi:excisionase family DNA binding protein
MPQGENTAVRHRLYRLKAASEYLSMSPWKLRRLIQEGRLPVVQDADGSPFLLDVRDLDAYVERSKRATAL